MEHHVPLGEDAPDGGYEAICGAHSIHGPHREQHNSSVHGHVWDVPAFLWVEAFHCLHLAICFPLPRFLQYKSNLRTALAEALTPHSGPKVTNSSMKAWHLHLHPLSLAQILDSIQAY